MKLLKIKSMVRVVCGALIGYAVFGSIVTYVFTSFWWKHVAWALPIYLAGVVLTLVVIFRPERDWRK